MMKNRRFHNRNLRFSVMLIFQPCATKDSIMQGPLGQGMQTRFFYAILLPVTVFCRNHSHTEGKLPPGLPSIFAAKPSPFFSLRFFPYLSSPWEDQAKNSCFYAILKAAYESP